MSTNRPAGFVRILHVVGGMNRGGVETWLLQILRHINRERFRMDFLVHTADPCAYDEEIRSLGSRIIACLGPRRPWFYARNFRRVLAAQGSYDIVHSHVHAYSGYVLRLARQAGVRSRIAHSHTDTRFKRRRANLLRRGYFALASREIRRHATAGLAASAQAAEALFGAGWQLQPLRRVLYYGCDPKPFRQIVDQRVVRSELGFNPDDLVIGHAGRFCEPKNHDFWVDVASELARREPRARFLLVGDGPLRPRVEAKIARLSLSGRFHLTGARPDVARLMLGAMDAMLFPSLWEGLPLAVVEAQAAGLPCVASQAVPEEAAVLPAGLRRLSLSERPDVWAQAVLAAAHGLRYQQVRGTGSPRAQSVQHSRFGISPRGLLSTAEAADGVKPLMEIAAQTYLITGGAGFIGSHLADLLLAEGHRVCVLDDISTGGLENLDQVWGHPRFEFVRATVTDEAAVDRLALHADVIIHLAAAVGVKLVVEQPVRTIETNVIGTECVLRVARRRGCKVLLASTSEVYGKGSRVPFAEDDDVLLGATARGRWCYAASKMLDEFLALAYRQEFGLPVVIFRLFNTIGPRQSGRYGMVVPRFLEQALAGKPITIFGDGRQSRCFCDVRDVVKAIAALARRPEADGRVFNIGSTEETTIRQLAERIKTLTQSRSPIVPIPYQEAYGPGFEDMTRRVPDTTRIRLLLGWEPLYTLNETLSGMIPSPASSRVKPAPLQEFEKQGELLSLTAGVTRLARG